MSDMNSLKRILDLISYNWRLHKQTRHEILYRRR